MPRYFIEVTYSGTNYSGSQKQNNANSIQSEIEKALQIFLKKPLSLTGASRTDAGVHALQNFFHFDSEDLPALNKSIEHEKSSYPAMEENLKAFVYRLNAVLPWDITINNLLPVTNDAHCRYDAVEREYKYFLHSRKNPFLKDRSYFFPYKLQYENLKAGAAVIRGEQNFASFSKKSTQTNNFSCTIYKSFWVEENNILIYTIAGNRFLRGMVRGLVGTMLKLGRGKINEDEFKNIFKSCSNINADFSAPGHGLFLQHIKYTSKIFL